jgi:hypothetical protein
MPGVPGTLENKKKGLMLYISTMYEVGPKIGKLLRQTLYVVPLAVELK